ncbi:hypothetical protein H6G97_51010 [Nostoc flagelliforme FACHB-838]|uniref:Uncharacterized protein n=1 Tax=Nostoc flagelliforme FACHB-838 TaxID=2692904 RepID=A0ABR8E5Q3_9NOSO|nr:hypothetical protein [Nostoc flagelliforme FACHB-838]
MTVPAVGVIFAIALCRLSGAGGCITLTSGLTQLAQCERQLLVHKYYLNLIPNALYL